MKSEIVKINNKYAVRFKKWYHLTWRYMGITTDWDYIRGDMDFCFVDTLEQAESKAKFLKKDFEVIKALN